MSERDLARIEAVARSVMNRLLHEPTLRLRTLGEERSHGRLQIMRELFGLDEGARGREAPEAEPATRQRAPAAAPRLAVRLGTRGSAARARPGADRRRAARVTSSSCRSRRPATATAPARRQGEVGQGARAGAAGRRDRPRRAQRQGRAERAARRAWSSSARPRAPTRATRSCGAASLDALPPGARVGTASVRRARAAARAARGPRGRRAARQRRHAPAQAGRRRGRRDRARRGRAACGSGAPTRDRLRADASSSPCAGQGTLVLEARADDDGARAPRLAVTDAATGMPARRARARARPGGELPHAAGRARDGRPDGIVLRDVRRPARRLGVAARRDAARPRPRARPASWPRGGCFRPAAASCCAGRRRSRRRARNPRDDRRLRGASPQRSRAERVR